MSVCDVRKPVSNRSFAADTRALNEVMSACRPLLVSSDKSVLLNKLMVCAAPVESVYGIT